MVSTRCNLAVKEELKKLGLHFIIVDMGVVDIMEDITPEQREQIRIALHKSGLELIDDKKATDLTPSHFKKLNNKKRELIKISEITEI